MNITLPTGSSRLAVLLRRICDELASVRISSIQGGEVKHTPRGTMLVIKPGKTTGGTSTGITLRGEHVPGSTYQKNEMVVIFTGASAGTYISLVDGNTTSPQNGTKWISLPMGSSVGAWT